MSSDLVALSVAIGLGVTVVGLGWRRRLGETTREWLPRFGGGSEQVTLAPESAGGGRRREFSPRERRWAIRFYLAIGLGYAAIAVLSASDRLLHASLAALFAISAAVYLRKGSPSSLPGSPS
jgi:hypothetical protein